MPGNELQIVVWNVEHGSAIYVRTPNDRHILLDAGASAQFSPARWLNNRRGVDQADLFLLSHQHSDHIQDIENVDRSLHPHAFLTNRSVPRELVYPTYPPEKNPLKSYQDFDARYIYDAPADHQLEPASNWGDVRIRTYYNSGESNTFAKLNDYSMVTFLLHDRLTFLFPGDLEAPGWEALMKRTGFCSLCTASSMNEGEVRILVAAHHGREAGVYRPFLDLFKPHLSVVSDVYGSPHTAYGTYHAAGEGHWIYDTREEQAVNRYVVSTKINNYVLIRSEPSGVFVRV